MFAERPAILIEELCVRSLERPGELRAVTLTGVNLVALGMNLEENAFPRRWAELFRDLLCANGRAESGSCRGEHSGAYKSEKQFAHGHISSCEWTAIEFAEPDFGPPGWARQVRYLAAGTAGLHNGSLGSNPTLPEPASA